MGSFSLIMEEKYEEFCCLYEKKLSTDKENVNLEDSDLLPGNYIMALMGAKRYDRLVEFCNEYIKQKKEERKNILYENETACEYIGLFMGYWCLCKYEEAENAIRGAVNAPMQDLAGIESPLLMYYSAVFAKNNDLRKEAMKIFKKKLRKNNSLRILELANVNYLLDKINEKELVDRCESWERDSLRFRETIKSYFYIALKKYDLGQLSEYKKYLVKAIDLYKDNKIVVLEYEYYLAKFQLESDTKIE